jgi:hypothetical protein
MVTVTKRLIRASMLMAIVAALGLITAACSGSVNSQTDGVPLTIASAPSGGYADGQTLSISVGPNSLFKPYSSIKIIQCADPGGGASGLPKSVKTCDGNTIQGNTVSPGRDGSFSEHGYVIYRLPNAQLAEDPSGIPVCNSTHPCVLYIGQNQEDFTKPKIFSAPFIVSRKAGQS